MALRPFLLHVWAIRQMALRPFLLDFWSIRQIAPRPFLLHFWSTRQIALDFCWCSPCFWILDFKCNIFSQAPKDPAYQINRRHAPNIRNPNIWMSDFKCNIFSQAPKDPAPNVRFQVQHIQSSPKRPRILNRRGRRPRLQNRRHAPNIRNLNFEC